MSAFCCSGVALRQFGPIASAVMRAKLKCGRTFSSTRAMVFRWLPDWMSLSCLMTPSTSCVTPLTRVSGAVSWASAAGAMSAAARMSEARVMAIQYRRLPRGLSRGDDARRIGRQHRRIVRGQRGLDERAARRRVGEGRRARLLVRRQRRRVAVVDEIAAALEVGVPQECVAIERRLLEEIGRVEQARARLDEVEPGERPLPGDAVIEIGPLRDLPRQVGERVDGSGRRRRARCSARGSGGRSTGRSRRPTPPASGRSPPCASAAPCRSRRRSGRGGRRSSSTRTARDRRSRAPPSPASAGSARPRDR